MQCHINQNGLFDPSFPTVDSDDALNAQVGYLYAVSSHDRIAYSYTARIARMIDEALIDVRAGDGGNGMMTFLREAMRPMGGPSGGNGGNGGAVVLTADDSLNSLLKFRWRRHFRAERGRNGEQNRRNGANGDDLHITVPIGTEVWEIVDDGSTERRVFVGDLAQDGLQLTVAKGGRGGTGNAAAVTSQNQEPRLAEAGEEGEVKRLGLNLKLIADVGLIGMPNAGKSSLLTAISAATPKVADYPFTTLEPVVGMVEHGFDAFAAVDIPGLIEGAAQGHGLGHTFLKHIQRTRLLLHIVDGSEDNITSRVEKVNSELTQFDESLAQKPQIIVVNKSDTEEVMILKPDIEAELRESVGPDRDIHFISAATSDGLDRLINATVLALGDAKRRVSAHSMPQQPANNHVVDRLLRTSMLLERDDLPVITPRIAEKPAIKLTDGAYRVTHRRAVRLAKGSDLSNWDAQVQYHQKLVQMNVARQLERLGAKAGDTVRAGEWELVWP